MDEKKLELTLGLPGDSINWSNNIKKSSVRERDESLLSLGYFNNNNNGGVIGCGKEHSNHHHHHHHHHPWVTSSSSSPLSCCSHKTQSNSNGSGENTTTTTNEKGVSVMGKDTSQPCSTILLHSANNNKPFSPSSVNTTAVPNTSQKRAAPAPVVGWPPIRSFRKNLASTSTGKPSSEPQSAIPSKPVTETPSSVKANGNKGQFVKINMDGVPIGRKVDLSAYNNYDSLSSAVDELFRGLLAAQRDSTADAKDNKQEEQKPITGLLDGSGEYTLVYEDNEGDRMLVGDVPWHMFVSTVKRLRVLKSSDLPTLNRGGSKEGKILDDCPSK